MTVSNFITSIYTIITEKETKYYEYEQKEFRSYQERTGNHAADPGNDRVGPSQADQRIRQHQRDQRARQQVEQRLRRL